MMLSAINLAFFAYLCCGEFTIPTGSNFDVTRHLSVGDVLFYPNCIHPISMMVRLKYSKTDPFSRVQVITLCIALAVLHVRSKPCKGIFQVALG